MVLEWALNPMTDTFIREERGRFGHRGDTQGRRSHKDRDRD